MMTAARYQLNTPCLVLDVDVFSAKADAGAVTIRHRSTEPRLDEKAPSEEVDSFDKVVICSGVLSRDLAHKTERSIRMTLSLAFVAPPICRGGDRGTPAAWFSRQASDGPGDDLASAMDGAWADAAS
jgi:hypothetical protein